MNRKHCSAAVRISRINTAAHYLYDDTENWYHSTGGAIAYLLAAIADNGYVSVSRQDRELLQVRAILKKHKAIWKWAQTYFENF